MSSSNLLKNIISKDKNLSENTIKELIKTQNSAGFRELCEKSDFIFPYIREKIINNFVKIINNNDLKTIFEFSKTYSYDFEDIIVKSWLKFANESLTDEILELFETGTDEQKAYCAKYFSFINDSLAPEYLEKHIFSEYEPLRINSVTALKAFKKDEIQSLIKEKILSLNNESDKVPLYQNLSVWSGEENIKFILKNAINSPYNGNIIANILDYCEFEKLKQYLNKDLIFKIFNILIENYPENIELNTIIYYQIYDFIEYLLKNPTPYSNNLLSVAKKQFLEYETNEIYNYDLDKDTKEELKNINLLLKSFNPDFSSIEGELDSSDSLIFETAVKTVQEYKIPTENKLAELFNSNDVQLNKKALIAQALKALNKTDLINKEKINDIKDENIKALILSLLV